MRVRDTLRRRFDQRRHTALLLAIVMLFALRPLLGDNGVTQFLASVALVTVALVALYAIQVEDLVGEPEKLLIQKRRQGFVGVALSVVAIAERLAMIIAPSPGLYIAGSISWLLYVVFVTLSLLRHLLKHKDVTGETLSLSMSVYLLLGLSWTFLYAVISELQPAAFSFAGTPLTSPAGSQNLFPVWIYFSLTTLSTIGFGDITPVSLQARYAAVAEGITGQFYLAILVARLVGLQMSRSSQETK